MNFNPLRDHERYSEKDPKEMSIEELRMLLKIKRMDLELGWLNFQGKINFWQRLGRSIKQTGILDNLQETLKNYLAKNQPTE